MRRLSRIALFHLVLGLVVVTFLCRTSPAAAEQGWQFEASASAVWSTYHVEVESRGQVQLDPGTVCSFLTPLGCGARGLEDSLRGSDNVRPDGFGAEFRIRVLLPFTILEAWPRLDVAYREPLHEIRDRSADVQLSVSYRRGAMIGGGLGWTFLDGRMGLSAGVGSEVGWFRANYRPTAFLFSEAESHTNTFFGLLSSLEARVRILDTPSVHLVVRATYTRWLSDRGSVQARSSENGGTIIADAFYKVENSATASFGISASF